jgi:hypothetical protein
LTSKRHFADDSLRRSRGTHPPLQTAGDPFSAALGVVGRLLLSANQRRLQIERTLGRTHLGGGEAEILGRGRKAAMTQQNLDGAYVGTGFQQMDGKGVPTMSCIGTPALYLRQNSRSDSDIVLSNLPSAPCWGKESTVKCIIGSRVVLSWAPEAPLAAYIGCLQGH